MAKTQQELDDERLQHEYEDLMRINQCSRLIEITALDGGRSGPPHRYRIAYRCTGYRSPGQQASLFYVNVTLPADYPRSLPLCQYDPATPIFHPHIFSDLAGVKYYICIGHSRQVGLPLREYIIGIGEMIQWKRDTERHGGSVDSSPLVDMACLERLQEAERAKLHEIPAREAGTPPKAPPAPPVRPGDSADLKDMIIFDEDSGVASLTKQIPSSREPDIRIVSPSEDGIVISLGDDLPSSLDEPEIRIDI